MKINDKTKEQLIKELAEMQRRIAELEKEEEALKESEEKYHKLFNNAIDAVCIFDLETRKILDVNDTYLKLYGYTRDEVLQLTTDDICAEPEETKKAIKKSTETGDMLIPVRKHRKKDGTVFQVELSAGPYKWKGRNVMFAIARDITKRKRAEQLHEKHVKRLETLYELSMMLSGDPIDIFQNAARMIGELLNVRVVCLSEIRGDELFFISVYVDGEVMTDVGSCPLSITPCATVQKSKDIRVFDHVATMFPEASFLKMHNAFSYCGFPSLNSAGDVNAVTCLLDDKSHDFSEDDKKLLQIFGQRIGLEIERQGNMNKHKKAEEALIESAERYRNITENSSFGISTYDESGQCVVANQALADMIGATVEQILSQNIHAIQSWQKSGMLEAAKEALESGEKKVKTVHVVSTFGKDVWLDCTFIPYHEKGDKFLLFLAEEISLRKKAEEQLEYMAYYDQLTSLPNRDHFVKHIRRMFDHRHYHSDYMFAMLFIDLDRFKLVNDSLGHIVGDKLLIEVAHRLEACNRANDRSARFGGDEFAVFLDDIKDVSSASRAANRIQTELQKPFNIDGQELFTSASIGIALSTSGYKNEQDMLRDADAAMYRAKATGKAHAEIFDQAMHVSVTEILQLESDLRTAVEKEQFMVYYQPIISATDSRITGAEALIRWNHPEKGFISPMDFIPIAEETGLISTIGEWVLRTACAQNKAWQDAGYPNLIMKVNFSSRQFKDDNLAELVKKVIKKTGMPARLLDVEITETIAMEEKSINILNQLTAMGLQTSIDDFGTGYSSLSSLTHFSINTIKIDMAFVKDIEVDVGAKAIIKAIIAMAHSLNMEVIAEGVETEDQLAYLQSQKCDKIQGYLFSPPVPEEEFRKLLEQNKIGDTLINKYSISMV